MENFTNLLMDECPPELQSPDDDIKETNVGMLKNNTTTNPSKTKGVAMSFGFKRRPNSAIPTVTNINKKDSVDSNGNDDELQNSNKTALKIPTTSNFLQQKNSRFGFRQTKILRTNNSNTPNKNHVIQNTQYNKTPRPQPTFDNNRNRPNLKPPANQMGKFILQTTQLPKPQSVRVVLDTKSTKTLINNNTKLDNLTFRRFYPSDFGRKIDANGENGDLGENSSGLDESFEAPKLPSVFHNAGNSSAFERKEIPAGVSEKTQKTFLKPTKTSTVKIFMKSTKIADNNRSSSDDQEWEFGGEALAEEPSLSLATETQGNSNKKLFIKKMLPLKAEDITTSSSTLLDDETSPVESLLSFTGSEDLKKKSTPDNKDATSPSNSSSLSEGKDDFLIDDEISDQPGLVFDDKSSQHNSEATLMESAATPRSRRKLRNFDGSPMFLKTKKNLGASALSLDTLSPCESIASDDLMMDYEFSQGSVDDGDAREKTRNAQKELDETLTLTITSSQSHTNSDINPEPPIKTWGESFKFVEKNPTVGKPRFLSTSTPTASPKRTPKFGSPRLTRRSNNASAPLETEDFLKLHKTTHTALKNDIVNVKAMLFKLRRVLNESETQNPLEQVMNGNCGETTAINDENLELKDLKRQLLFLQGQLEDKEKTVATLQKQLTKMCIDNYVTSPIEHDNEDKEVYNAATQTDRIRPVGYVSPTSLTSPGSLISMNEWARRT